MKRILRKYIELGLIWFVVLSSGLTLYLNWTGDSFDPVREIQKLRNDNGRDDALDMAKVFKQSQPEPKKRRRRTSKPEEGRGGGTGQGDLAGTPGT